MTLRLIQISNGIPFSFPLDVSATFQAGMLAQLGVMGNNIVCGVSDGTAPIGIIDDVRTTSFIAPSIDEIVIVGPIAGVAGPGGSLVTPNDVKMELENPNVMASSFTSDPVDVELIPRNGVIVFLAGTALNFDSDGDGIPDSIRTRVNYSYQVPNVPGDDSTQGSGRITVWITRGIYATDQFATNVRYPVNASLFSGTDGKLTTTQSAPDIPGIAIVTGPPSAINGSLELLLL